MSITTYTELKTAVSSWLARSDLTTYVGDFITLGEKRVYRDLRIRCMETALSSTIASGVIAVPDGYVAMKYAYVQATPIGKLERKDAEWVYQNYPTRSADGQPIYFAREADNFIFGPYPDSTYTIKGIYYKRLTALSASNETNWFTANSPDLLLFAALCEAAPFLKADNRIQIWETKYKMVKDSVQLEDDQEEFSGSPLAMTSR
jgi:hypothetical protein